LLSPSVAGRRPYFPQQIIFDAEAQSGRELAEKEAVITAGHCVSLSLLAIFR
jgi:hypothetical protein